jgi:hypothetical protein
MQDKADTSAPIAYMARTAAYYVALGYGAPYQWAHNETAPFTPLGKPLGQCRIALVTTAALFDPALGDQGAGAAYNAGAKFYQVYAQPVDGEPDVRISHIAYDRAHTTADDPNSWFPLAQLKRQAERGGIGGVTENFYGLPTNRSQATTRNRDAPALLALLLQDDADVALLVANCPVCHQSVTLAARHLEANGIATVVMGCAKDIVEHAGAPRFLFSDFPLGNGAGPPHDERAQAATLDLALDLLESAKKPQTTSVSPLVWPGDPDWKLDYCNIDRLTPEEIAQKRRAFDRDKKTAKAIRTESAIG